MLFQQNADLVKYFASFRQVLKINQWLYSVLNYDFLLRETLTKHEEHYNT